jgi:DnaJ family protein C protein 7
MESNFSLTNKLAEELKETGNTCYREENYSKAIEYYTKAIECDDSNFKYYLNKARAHCKLKKFKECIEDCETALKLEPQSSKAPRLMARSFFALGKLNEAKVHYEKAVDVEGFDQELSQEFQCFLNVEKKVMELEKCLIMDKLDHAKAAFDDLFNLCVETVNKDLISLEFLDSMLTGYLDTEAMIFSDKQPQVSAEQLRMRKQLLKEMLKLGTEESKFEVTKRIFKQQESLKAKGNNLLKMKKFQAAIETYDEAINLNEQNQFIIAVLYTNRAIAYCQLGQIFFGIADCNRAIGLHPNYAKAYLRKAEIYLLLKAADCANKELQIADIINPLDTVTNSLLQEVARLPKDSIDFYKILGVSKEASQDEIKKAYKSLSLTWHPDKWNNKPDTDKRTANEIFLHITEAYGILNNIESKTTYDEKINFSWSQSSKGIFFKQVHGKITESEKNGIHE